MYLDLYAVGRPKIDALKRHKCACFLLVTVTFGERSCNCMLSEKALFLKLQLSSNSATTELGCTDLGLTMLLQQPTASLQIYSHSPKAVH